MRVDYDRSVLCVLQVIRGRTTPENKKQVASFQNMGLRYLVVVYAQLNFENWKHECFEWTASVH